MISWNSDRPRLAADGLGEAARKPAALAQTRIASMMCAFFTQGPVVDWATAKKSDTKAYAKFFHQMLEAGVYLAPSQFEAAFMSLGSHAPGHRSHDQRRAHGIQEPLT